MSFSVLGQAEGKDTLDKKDKGKKALAWYNGDRCVKGGAVEQGVVQRKQGRTRLPCKELHSWQYSGELDRNRVNTSEGEEYGMMA